MLPISELLFPWSKRLCVNSSKWYVVESPVWVDTIRYSYSYSFIRLERQINHHLSVISEPHTRSKTGARAAGGKRVCSKFVIAHAMRLKIQLSSEPHHSIYAITAWELQVENWLVPAAANDASRQSQRAKSEERGVIDELSVKGKQMVIDPSTQAVRLADTLYKGVGSS